MRNLFAPHLPQASLHIFDQIRGIFQPNVQPHNAMPVIRTPLGPVEVIGDGQTGHPTQL